MLRKEYKCNACEMTFERTVFEEESSVKCPVCGSNDLILAKTEEKQPQTCNQNSKYT